MEDSTRMVEGDLHFIHAWTHFRYSNRMMASLEFSFFLPLYNFYCSAVIGLLCPAPPVGSGRITPHTCPFWDVYLSRYLFSEVNMRWRWQGGRCGSSVQPTGACVLLIFILGVKASC